MPMDRSLYPDDWTSIALAIKTAAQWQCQECDRPCRRPGETEWELYQRIENQHWHWADDLEGEDANGEPTLKQGRFTLTVAHLNHIPSDCRPENLLALCSVCHLRYDRSQMALKKRLKRERLGQLNLLEEAARQGKDFAKVQPTLFRGGDRHG